MEDSISIPEPLEESFSGQFKLRMPKSLYKELMEKSKEEDISMNQYCLYLLNKGIAIQSKS
ncbi:toxin-antitoxin system HicB family antitoxin [Clostridium coskatii]|uniref:toxin-antitoxin system HicB family antitoxin n=1 Tax=Clostridium coskatii TaxID=1705578 RepID=UPI000AE5B4F6